MRTIKAAFLRCRQEGWLAITIPDLDAVVAVLEQHGGEQLQHEVFTPPEMRAVLKAAALREEAAILIGLNCAVGNMDMGRLTWGDIVERQVGG
jgi:hypothetical protein